MQEIAHINDEKVSYASRLKDSFSQMEIGDIITVSLDKRMITLFEIHTYNKKTGKKLISRTDRGNNNLRIIRLA